MNDIKKVLIVAICVVLVIAIAAGVSIGVMANTMNGLKDRVEELDQAYASDVAAMKAEIEAAKAANENLVTAADFEAKLAAAIGEQNQTMQSLISTAVKNQIEDLEVEGLTEEQVNEIIDAAVANCLTEADIDAIIADIDTGLTKDEVKKLITNNTAGYLTYAQIANMIDDADYDLRAYLERTLKTYMNNLVAALESELRVDLEEVKGDIGDLEDGLGDVEYAQQETYKVEGTTVSIGTPRALIEWAASVNAGDDYKGYTVTLTADIDLAGLEWTPINASTKDNGNNLVGMVFDGDGYTISNMTVKKAVTSPDGQNVAGFFGGVERLVVKDVFFVKAYVSSGDATSAYAGVVAGRVFNSKDSSFENIYITQATVEGLDKCGGAFGFVNEYTMVLKNVDVYKSTIGTKNTDVAGEIVGRTGVQLVFAACDAENNTCTTKHDDGSYAGGLVGKGPEAIATEVTNCVVVSNSAALATAIADDTDGEIDLVLLSGEYDIDFYSVPEMKSLTINGAGANTKIAFSNLQVRASQFDELTINNCTIERMPNKSWGHLVFGSSNTAGGVYTISNCIFNGVGTQGIYINQNVEATFNIENCTFTGDFGSEGAITIQNNNNVDITVNVTDCTFNEIPATSHEIFVFYPYNGWTLNAEGVTAHWDNRPQQ